MKLFPLSKNGLVLSLVGIVAIGFFTGGMLEILDYFIVKALLFASYAVLLAIAIYYANKNEDKKKRPEDKLQDDFH